MRVMLGETVQRTDANGDHHWHKAEVELDETDLLRLIVEAGFEPGVNALDTVDLSVRDAFNLLEVETEILLGAALVLNGGLDKETYVSARATLESRKAKTVEKVKAQVSG
jgi:hypothetical protein